MEPPRVEELGPDGAPSSSVPFDAASWVDPLSSEWVYVDADDNANINDAGKMPRTRNSTIYARVVQKNWT